MSIVIGKVLCLLGLHRYEKDITRLMDLYFNQSVTICACGKKRAQYVIK